MEELVICKNCKQTEYSGMMHWLHRAQYCRCCMYRIWQETVKNWSPGPRDYTFPIYEDGKDRRNNNG